MNDFYGHFQGINLNPENSHSDEFDSHSQVSQFDDPVESQGQTLKSRSSQIITIDKYVGERLLCKWLI